MPLRSTRAKQTRVSLLSIGAVIAASVMLSCTVMDGTASATERQALFYSNVSPKTSQTVHPTVNVTPSHMPNAATAAISATFFWPNSNVWNAWGRVADFGAWNGLPQRELPAPSLSGHCVTTQGSSQVSIVIVGGGNNHDANTSGRVKRTYTVYCSALGAPLQDFDIHPDWSGIAAYTTNHGFTAHNNHPNVRWIVPAGTVDKDNMLTIHYTQG